MPACKTPDSPQKIRIANPHGAIHEARTLLNPQPIARPITPKRSAGFQPASSPASAASKNRSGGVLAPRAVRFKAQRRIGPSGAKENSVPNLHLAHSFVAQASLPASSQSVSVRQQSPRTNPSNPRARFPPTCTIVHSPTKRPHPAAGFTLSHAPLKPSTHT
jgi:hypothetical protein